MEDPYDIDQSAIEEKLRYLQEAFDRWRKIRQDEASDADGNLEDEYRWLTNELKQSAKSLTWDLDDLIETSQLVHQRSPNEQLLRQRLNFARNSLALVTAIDSELRAVTDGLADAGRSPPSPSPPHPPPPRPLSPGQPAVVEATVFDSDDELLIPEPVGELVSEFDTPIDNELGLGRPVRRRHRLGVAFVACAVSILLLIMLLWLAGMANRSRPAAAAAAAANASGVESD